MAITEENVGPLRNRLAKAIGHLNSVMRMVDEKRYCVDVLNQLKAVQSALDKTAELILQQHMETCVVEAIRNKETSRVVEELMLVFSKAPDLNLSMSGRESGSATSAPRSLSECNHACCITRTRSCGH